MNKFLGPDPNNPFPRPWFCFIKNIVKNPNIIIGDFTYYAGVDPQNFEKNVLYHFDALKDKLIIGKYCQIGYGVKFIMNGANHRVNDFTTYPFPYFEGWNENLSEVEWPIKGDIIIGNDVWIGYNSTIMPGIKVGDGAVIGSNSLVTEDVPPYTIVGGNPARFIRKRFDDQIVDILLNIKWWDWEMEKIIEFLPILCSNNEKVLKSVYAIK